MTRDQLEHLLRAAGDITDDDEIVVFGSQAILGQFPDAPQSLRVSVEADLMANHYPDRSDLIDGSIGELSPFHDTFGYYAQGIAEETAILPAGWRDRLVPICNANTRGVTGLCLEIHDLTIAKGLANREKDRTFLAEVVRHRLVDEKTLLRRLSQTPTSAEASSKLEARIRSEFQKQAATL